MTRGSARRAAVSGGLLNRSPIPSRIVLRALSAEKQVPPPRRILFAGAAWFWGLDGFYSPGWNIGQGRENGKGRGLAFATVRGTVAEASSLPDSKLSLLQEATMEKLLIALSVVVVAMLMGLWIAQAAMATPQFQLLVGALH